MMDRDVAAFKKRKPRRSHVKRYINSDKAININIAIVRAFVEGKGWANTTHS